MAIGKAGVTINLEKLSIKFGDLNVVYKGKVYNNYNERNCNYMKNSNIEIIVDAASGNKNSTVYTMDLTKKYIEINADYRSESIEILLKIVNKIYD